MKSSSICLVDLMCLVYIYVISVVIIERTHLSSVVILQLCQFMLHIDTSLTQACIQKSVCCIMLVTSNILMYAEYGSLSRYSALGWEN